MSTTDERHLRERATFEGFEPAELATVLVRHGLATSTGPISDENPGDAVRRLFAQREAEDPVTGPDDLRQREAELEPFKAGMNAAATSGHPVFP